MPKRSSKKQSSDVNVLAASIVQAATEQKSTLEKAAVHEAAVALGRLGGLKGGPARAKKLSAKARSRIAKKAALTRWASEATENNA